MPRCPVARDQHTALVRPWGLTDGACYVIQRVLNPGFLRYMASCDVASNICQALKLGPNAWVPLSQPVEVWHFDFQNPPEESANKSVDLAFQRDGRFNAVV